MSPLLRRRLAALAFTYLLLFAGTLGFLAGAAAAPDRLEMHRPEEAGK